MEDNEDAFLDFYMNESDLETAAYELCHEKSRYCNANLNGIYGDSRVSLVLKLQ